MRLGGADDAYAFQIDDDGRGSEEGGLFNACPLPRIEGCGGETPGVQTAGMFCGSCFGIFLIFVASSIASVPPLNYGVRYNVFTKFVDLENTYPCGRYFVGPLNRFLLFPANVQTVEFISEQLLPKSGERYPSLHTRTIEGLPLHLQVSLQYRLHGHKIGELCGEFGMHYQDMFVATIRDSLIYVASKFEAIELWKHRKLVGQRMQESLNRSLSSTFAECWGLQLLIIELPPDFDKAIVATEVQNQKIQFAEFSKLEVNVQAKTTVIKSMYERRVKVIEAAGKANYSVATKVAVARARAKRISTDSQVLQAVVGDLKLVQEDLLDFQRFNAVKSLTNSSMFFGFYENGDEDAAPPPPDIVTPDLGGGGAADKEKESPNHKSGGGGGGDNASAAEGEDGAKKTAGSAKDGAKKPSAGNGSTDDAAAGAERAEADGDGTAGSAGANRTKSTTRGEDRRLDEL